MSDSIVCVKQFTRPASEIIKHSYDAIHAVIFMVQFSFNSI